MYSINFSKAIIKINAKYIYFFANQFPLKANKTTSNISVTKRFLHQRKKVYLFSDVNIGEVLSRYMVICNKRRMINTLCTVPNLRTSYQKSIYWDVPESLLKNAYNQWDSRFRAEAADKNQCQNVSRRITQYVS